MSLIKSLLVSVSFLLPISALAVNQRSVENIDLEWRFHLGDVDGASQPGYDDSGWRRLDLPHDWAVEGDFSQANPSGVTGGALPGGVGWYRKTFIIDAADEGKRVSVLFEGSYMNTEVFVNGRPLGVRPYGYVSFGYDITPYIKWGGENVVAVRVDNSEQPNSRWYSGCGIYRSVYLVRTPAVFIRDFFIRLVPDSTFSHVALDFSVDGCGQGSAHLALRELGLEEDVVFSGGQGHAVFDVKPELWSPAGPKLYDVSLSVGDDEVHDRVGFREIRVEGMRILLNGEDVFLKGISVHEDDIELGKTTTEESIRRTIRLVKDDLHGIFIRLAHYPHSRLFSRIADEMGVLLWEEVPVYWAIAFDDDDTLADARNQLEELVLRDRNRASVIVWSVGNENPDTDERLAFMSALAARAREMDGTRCISAACLVNEAELRIEDRLSSVLDIIGLNEYYGWYKPDFSELGRLIDNSAPDRPVVISECGADARYGNHGTIDMKWTEEAQAEVYRRQVDEISRTDYIRGMTPWILYDFRAPRRQNIWQEGFNRKGLVDSDRVHRKMAFDVLAGFYESII